MTRYEAWREVLGHDGHVVLRLRLFTPAEGGQKRPLTSGYRADWIVSESDPTPTRAPIEFDDRRSARPGDEVDVRAYPFQPERWAALPVGAGVGLWWRLDRFMGAATLLGTVNLPTGPVPLRPSVNRRGESKATAVLRRRT